MLTAKIKVNHSVGLHARPASVFVKTCAQFESDIQVANSTDGSEAVNAKSILSVLTLGVHQGHDIELVVEGPDEAQAMQALKELIASNFGEEE